MDAVQQVRRKFAVLVDADNVKAEVLQAVLSEVEKEGDARFRIMFGHIESVRGHKESANMHGFRPVVHFNVADGKNAADIALVIKAMELLHEGTADAFCIVASDSDYHPLALYLREAGKHVLGIGREDTPLAMKSACHRFVPLEVLTQPPPNAPSGTKPKAGAKPAGQPVKKLDEFRNLFGRALQATQEENGLAALALLGSQLRILDPGFDHRQYGRKSLTALVQEAGFELVPPPPVPLGETQYVRVRA